MRMVQDIFPVKAVESDQLVVSDEEDPQLESGRYISVAQCIQKAN